MYILSLFYIFNFFFMCIIFIIILPPQKKKKSLTPGILLLLLTSYHIIKGTGKTFSLEYFNIVSSLRFNL